MNNGSQHDDLLRQMAGARAALSRNAQSAVDNARTLADWKFHYRNHPWLCCGAAAAAGYLLVPQRRAQPQRPRARRRPHPPRQNLVWPRTC